MRTFTAMIRRDLVEKRLVFLAMLALGILVVFTPLMPKARNIATPRDLRDIVAGFCAVIVSLGLALTMGFTTITKDVTEKRFSFYFSKPISGFVIWAGKIGGAFIVAMLAGLIVVTPATIMGGGLITYLQGPSQETHGLLSTLPALSPVLLVTALVAGLILFAHFHSVIVVDRSVTLVLDMIGWFVYGYSLWLIGHFVANTRAMGLLSLFVFASLIVTFTAMAAAGAVQVIKGRTDLRRGHHLLSATFWAASAVFILVTLLYLKWVVSGTPKGAAVAALNAAAPAGDWIAIQGHSRSRLDYEQNFLVNARTGSFIRTRAHQTAFSQDGTTAAWLEPASFDRSTLSLKLARLNSSAVVRDTNITVKGWPAMSLSADGGRIAFLADGFLTVFDTNTMHSLATVRAEKSGWNPRLIFMSPDSLRVLDNGSIRDLDIASKRMITSGMIAKEHWSNHSQILGVRGDTLIFRNNVPEHTVWLASSRTGAVIAPLASAASDPKRRVFAGYLTDGRIFALEGAELKLMTPDGRLMHTIRLPQDARLFGGSEIEPGKLVFNSVPAFRKGEEYLEHSRLLIVDVSTGVIQEKGDHLASLFWGWMNTDPSQVQRPGSASTRVFAGPGGSLVYLDLQSGERRTIAGGSMKQGAF